MPIQSGFSRCTSDHRVQLLKAAASGNEAFCEMLDSYAAEEPYFRSIMQNVRAELVAAYQQGLQAGAGARLTNRQGYWTLQAGTDYPPKRLTGCIVHDAMTEEVFWILRSVSSFRKMPAADDGDDYLAQTTGHLGLDVDVMLRVWFGAGESEKGIVESGQRSLKELCPTFDLLSSDTEGNNSMDKRDRVIEVVMFAADYAERYAAALRGAGDLTSHDLLAMVLNPARARPGSFQPLLDEVGGGALNELNTPQRGAVGGLRHRLEVIHGPPGTGKSTTIFGLLSARVPPERTACVTCVTNQAIEAVCEKLRAVRWHLPFTVVGNPESLGPVSRRFILKQQVAREDEVIQAQDVLASVKREVEDLEKRRVEVGSGTEEFAKITQRLQYLWAEEDYCEKDRDAAAEFAARGIVRSTRVFVCTIASLHRISMMESQFGKDFPGAPHTVVVDEAGATPESYVPQILRTGVENLVLLGDHKQLPPLVLTLDISEMEAKQVNRSLMERALVQMPDSWVHRLTVQYRMPTAICQLVSKLFYEHSLSTGGNHAEAPVVVEQPVSLRWLVVRHAETSVGTSRQNLGEAAVIVSWLRRKVPEARRQGKTVKCLTFYRLQRNLIQAGLDDDEMKACVLSVDATQGSEADHVILSTVRSNDKGELGFCADPRRLCVALSRAKETLTIVGDPVCMRTGLWAIVWDSVEAKHARPVPGDVESLKQWVDETQRASTRVCRFFLQGRCSRAECAFSHDVSACDQMKPQRYLDWAPRNPSCVDGIYPHPLQPPRPQSQQRARSRRAGGADSGTEAKPCQYFAQGRCKKGQNCPFSHTFTPGDRRVTAEIRASAAPCQFHLMGRCTKGPNCTFAHNFNPGDRRVAAQVRKKAEPCQFYAQGRCRNGAACTFSHY